LFELKKRKFHSEFFKNTATLASGTTLAQGISIISAPILYRIYDKTDYGTLGLYMAVTGVISVFSTLQYPNAILLEGKDQNAKQILWFTLLITVGFSFLTLLIMLLGRHLLVFWLNNKEVGFWLLFAPLSVFSSGMTASLSVWANRKKYYKLLSFNTVLIAILVPIISISIGLINHSPLGLFIGLWVSQITSVLVLFIYVLRKDHLKMDEIALNSMRFFAKKYYKFPLYSLPTAFFHQFSNQLPVFMLGRFAGTATVGVYNLSVRLLGMPLQLITRSVGEVFRQRAAEDFAKMNNSYHIWKETFKSLALTSIIPFIVLFISAPDLFAFVFGEEWRQAGVFARILSLMYLFRFVVQPLSFMFTIVQRQNEDFLWHVWVMISNISLFWLGFKYFQSTEIVLILFSVNYAIIYLIYLFRSLQFSINKNNVYFETGKDAI
jgi:O-antigen/teichoic acid export membrane protein